MAQSCRPLVKKLTKIDIPAICSAVHSVCADMTICSYVLFAPLTAERPCLCPAVCADFVRCVRYLRKYRSGNIVIFYLTFLKFFLSLQSTSFVNCHFIFEKTKQTKHYSFSCNINPYFLQNWLFL